MNWLDSTIAAVAPVWGARRAAARAALGQLRAYDLAKLGRRTENWLAMDGSANAELAGAGTRPRSRARDLVRNNPWAAVAARKYATKVVGTGIIPRLPGEVGSPRRRRQLLALWNEFVNRCDPEGRHDLFGLQHLVARTKFEAGEVLVRLIRRDSSSGLRIPLQLQVLEADYLDSTKTEAHADGSAVIMGVHYNRDGSRRGYWLYDQHPGELLPGLWNRLQSHFVPARDLLHIYEQDRPGQVRGVTRFAAVGLKLRDLDDYDDAELMRKKIAACFVGVFTSPAGGAKSGLAAPDGRAAAPVRKMAPGQILHGAPGEEVTFSSPPSDETYVEYMRQQLRAIAAGLGLTYEQLTGDLSELNFSSIKAGLNDFYDLLDHEQHLVLIPQLCVPVWAAFMEYAVLRGAWSVTEPLEPRWVPPRRRLADPTKEIPAYKDAVRSGFMTLDDVWAEQGEDADERMDSMARINAGLDARGLILDSDPRQDRPPAAPPPADPPTELD